jgi:dTDP-4-amino-4,6-dideoxygalactose transaminase
LPATEAVASRVLSLPNGAALDDAQLAGVVDVIRQAMHRAPEVRRALEGSG